MLDGAADPAGDVECGPDGRAGLADLVVVIDEPQVNSRPAAGDGGAEAARQVPDQLEVLFAADARAPWFFLWVQELLRVAPPLLAGVLTPLVVLLALSILPYTLDRSEVGVGQWFNRPGRVAQVTFLAILVGIALLTLRGASR